MAKQAQVQNENDGNNDLAAQLKALQEMVEKAMAKGEVAEVVGDVISHDPNKGEVKGEMQRNAKGEVVLTIPSIKGRSFTSFPVSASGKTRLICSAHQGYTIPGMERLVGADGQPYSVYVQYNVTARPAKG